MGEEEAVSHSQGKVMTETPLCGAEPRMMNVSTGICPGVPVVFGGRDVLVKKKRGRPRKYDADGNMRLSCSSSPFPPPSGFSITPGETVSSPDYSGTGRGRPQGSGGWEILSSLGDLFGSTAGGDFTPHVVTVNTGEDVVSKILSFSYKGPRGICVLSANGAVSSVTIRQPGYSGGILTYEGRFEILSLSGSYKIRDTNGSRSSNGGLSVSLAGPDGRVIGGSIAGSLTAASPIQIVVGSFKPSWYRTQKRKYETSSRPKFAHECPSAAKPVFSDGLESLSTTVEKQEVCVTATALQEDSGRVYREPTLDLRDGSHSTVLNGLETKSAEHSQYPDINLSVVGE